jgi:hypothetical protein
VGIDAVIVEPGLYPTKLGANRTAPADLARIAPYNAAFQRMAAILAAGSRGSDGLPPPDPQEVVDVIANLIETPTGERPLRTVVAVPGQREASLLINEAAHRAGQAAAEAVGLAHV